MATSWHMTHLEEAQFLLRSLLQLQEREREQGAEQPLWVILAEARQVLEQLVRVMRERAHA